VDFRHAYFSICGIAILVAFFDTRTVLTLASRAFAFYYTLQCMVAINVSRNRHQRIAIALIEVAIGFNDEQQTPERRDAEWRKKK